MVQGAGCCQEAKQLIPNLPSNPPPRPPAQGIQHQAWGGWFAHFLIQVLMQFDMTVLHQSLGTLGQDLVLPVTSLISLKAEIEGRVLVWPNYILNKIHSSFGCGSQ